MTATSQQHSSELKLSEPEKEAKTVPAKYVFLDVVDFSHNRSVEAQSYIVEFLNRIVTLALSRFHIDKSDRLLLPTGDGICIALLNIVQPYDIHLQLALKIIELVNIFQGFDVEDIDKTGAEGPEVELVLVSDDPVYLQRLEMRQFQVRIGIEANIDNLVTDVNGNPNIAGAGINMAQRVMGLADGNQILVSESVFKELKHREKYIKAFRKLPTASVKHNAIVSAYQFVDEAHDALNTDYPEGLKPRGLEPRRLTKLSAYYFALAMLHEKFLTEKYESSNEYEGEVFLWVLAKDLVKKSEAKTERDKIHYEKYDRTKKTLDELHDQVRSSNWEMLSALHEYIDSTALSGYTQFFEGYGDSRFLTTAGKEKLKAEWPEIWTELQLDRVLLSSAAS